MNYGKLKAKARKSLSKNYKTLIPAVLFMIGLGFTAILISKIIDAKWISFPLALIVDALFMMGFIKMVSNGARNRKIKLEQLFSQTDQFFTYIGITLLAGLFIGVLCLLEAISFKSLVVVVTYQAEINFTLSVFLIVFGLVLSTVIVLTIIYMIISFSQALFILNDEPKLNSRQALSMSFDMMEDYIVDYFLLVLSFIGWIIIGLFTFGLLYIWLVPYMYLTMAYFYEYIKKSYRKTINKEEIETIPNDKDVKEEK